MLHKRNSRKRRMLMMPMALLLAALMTFSGMFSTLAYAGDLAVTNAGLDAQHGVITDLSSQGVSSPLLQRDGIPELTEEQWYAAADQYSKETLSNADVDDEILSSADFEPKLGNDGSLIGFDYNGSAAIEIVDFGLSGTDADFYLIEYQWPIAPMMFNMPVAMSPTDATATDVSPTDIGTDNQTTDNPEGNGTTAGDPEGNGTTAGDPEGSGSTAGDPEGNGTTVGDPEGSGTTSGDPEGSGSATDGSGEKSSEEASAGGYSVGAGFGILINRDDDDDPSGGTPETYEIAFPVAVVELYQNKLSDPQGKIYFTVSLKDKTYGPDHVEPGIEKHQCTSSDVDAVHVLSGAPVMVQLTLTGFNGFGFTVQNPRLEIALPNDLPGEQTAADYEKFFAIDVSDADYVDDSGYKYDPDSDRWIYWMDLSDEAKLMSASIFPEFVLTPPAGITPDGWIIELDAVLTADFTSSSGEEYENYAFIAKEPAKIVSHAQEDWTIAKVITKEQVGAADGETLLTYKITVTPGKPYDPVVVGGAPYGRQFITAFTLTDLLDLDAYTGHTAQEKIEDMRIVKVTGTKPGVSYNSQTGTLSYDFDWEAAGSADALFQTFEFEVEVELNNASFRVPFTADNAPKSTVTNVAQLDYLRVGENIATIDGNAEYEIGFKNGDPGYIGIEFTKNATIHGNEQELTKTFAEQYGLGGDREKVSFIATKEGDSAYSKAVSLASITSGTVQFSFDSEGTYKIYEKIAAGSAFTNTDYAYDAAVGGYLLYEVEVALANAGTTTPSFVGTATNVKSGVPVALAGNNYTPAGTIANPTVPLGGMEIMKRKGIEANSSTDAGVVFELWNAAASINDADFADRAYTFAATNASGKATLHNIIPGKYYLVEVVENGRNYLPAGFVKVDGSKRYYQETPITVNATGAVTSYAYDKLTVLNEPDLAVVQVSKKFIGPDGSEATGSKAVFGVYKRGGTQDELITSFVYENGVSGVANLSKADIDSGDYYVKEISATDQYGKESYALDTNEHTIMAKDSDYNATTGIYAIIIPIADNVSQNGLLKIEKSFATATNWEAPAGSVYFELQDALGTAIASGTDAAKGIHLGSGLTWSADGKYIVMAFSKQGSIAAFLTVPSATDYKIVEVKLDGTMALYYDLADDTTAEVTSTKVQKNGTAYEAVDASGKTHIAAFSNPQRPSLTVEKVDLSKTTETLITNNPMTFKLYVKSGTTYEEYTGSYTSKTGNDGTATIYGLPYGDYIVVETAAPTGYYLNPDYADKGAPITAMMAKIERKGSNQIATVGDYPFPDVPVKKVDDAGTAISGIRFALFSDTDPVDANKVKDWVATSASGIANFAKLAPGTYYLYEDAATLAKVTGTPVTWYDQSNMGYVKITVDKECNVTFDLTSASDLYVKTATNVSGTNSGVVVANPRLVDLRVIKFSDSMEKPGYVSIRTPNVEFTLFEGDENGTRLYVRSETDAKTGIVWYDVLNTDGSPMQSPGDTMLTDAEGEIYIRNLKPNTEYTLVETVPNGYYAKGDDNIQPITLKTKAQLGNVDMEELIFGNEIEHYKIRIFKEHFEDVGSDRILVDETTATDGNYKNGKFYIFTDPDHANEAAELAEAGLYSDLNVILAQAEGGINGYLYLGSETGANTALSKWLGAGKYYIVEVEPPIDYHLYSLTDVDNDGIYDNIRAVDLTQMDYADNGSIVNADAFLNPHYTGSVGGNPSYVQLRVLKLGQEYSGTDLVYMPMDNVDFEVYHNGTKLTTMTSGNDRGYSDKVGGYALSEYITVYSPDYTGDLGRLGIVADSTTTDINGAECYVITFTVKEIAPASGSHTMAGTGEKEITVIVPIQTDYTDTQLAYDPAELFDKSGNLIVSMDVINAPLAVAGDKDGWDRAFRNELAPFSVNIQKQEVKGVYGSATTRGMPMVVEFDLYKLNETTGKYEPMSAEFKGLRTGENGEVKVDGLSIGSYAIKETALISLTSNSGTYGSSINDYIVSERYTRDSSIKENDTFATLFEIHSTTSVRITPTYKMVNPVKMQLKVQKGEANPTWSNLNANATFELTYPDGTPKTASTNASGIATFADWLVDSGTAADGSTLYYYLSETNFTSPKNGEGNATHYQSAYVYRFTVKNGAIDTVQVNYNGAWKTITQVPANGTTATAIKTGGTGNTGNSWTFRFANPANANLTIYKMVTVPVDTVAGTDIYSLKDVGALSGTNIEFTLEQTSGGNYSDTKTFKDPTNNQVTFAAVPIGEYRLTETITYVDEATDYRFVTTTNVWTFEVEANLASEKYIGNARIKTGSVANENGATTAALGTDNLSLTVYNKALNGAIRIAKEDDFGKPVYNDDKTVFNIYTKTDYELNKDDLTNITPVKTVSLEDTTQAKPYVYVQLPAGVYTIVEVSTNDDLIVTKEKPPEVTVVSGQTTTGQILFTNPRLYSVTFEKYAQVISGSDVAKGAQLTGDVLADAKFTLEMKDSADNWATITDVDSFGSADSIDFGKLGEGTYRITEDAYPLGYEPWLDAPKAQLLGDANRANRPYVEFEIQVIDNKATLTDVTVGGESAATLGDVWGEAVDESSSDERAMVVRLGNEPTGYYVQIEKYDESGDLITSSPAEFVILFCDADQDAKNETRHELTTTDGITPLYGPVSYYLDDYVYLSVEETIAPNGYVLDDYRYPIKKMIDLTPYHAEGIALIVVSFTNVKNEDVPTPSITKSITSVTAGGADVGTISGGNAQIPSLYSGTDYDFTFVIDDIFTATNTFPLRNFVVSDIGMELFSDANGTTKVNWAKSDGKVSAKDYVFHTVTVTNATYTAVTHTDATGAGVTMTANARLYAAKNGGLSYTEVTIFTNVSGARVFTLDANTTSFYVTYDKASDDNSNYQNYQLIDDKTIVGADFTPGPIEVSGTLFDRSSFSADTDEVLSVVNTAKTSFGYVKRGETQTVKVPTDNIVATDTAVFAMEGMDRAYPQVTIQKGIVGTAMGIRYYTDAAEAYKNIHTFVITVTNVSGDETVTQPVVIDMLPEKLQFAKSGTDIVYRMKGNPAVLAALGNPEQVWNDSNTVAWIFGESATLAPGASFTIEVDVVLQKGIASAINYTNNAYFTTLKRNVELYTGGGTADKHIEYGLGYQKAEGNYAAVSEVFKGKDALIDLLNGLPANENYVIYDHQTINLAGYNTQDIAKSIKNTDGVYVTNELVKIPDLLDSRETVEYRVELVDSAREPLTASYYNVGIVDILPMQEDKKGTDWNADLFDGGTVTNVYVTYPKTDGSGDEVKVDLVPGDDYTLSISTDATLKYDSPAIKAPEKWSTVAWISITGNKTIPAGATLIYVALDNEAYKNHPGTALEDLDAMFGKGMRLVVEYEMRFKELWSDTDLSENYTKIGYNSAIGASTKEKTSIIYDVNSTNIVPVALYPATVKVGDYVWIDEDYDGIQGTNEQGVADQVVTLYKYDAQNDEWDYAAKTTTTDIGYYEFDVEPTVGEYKNVYRIKFDISATYEHNGTNHPYVITKPFADVEEKASDSDVFVDNGDGKTGYSPAFVVDYLPTGVTPDITIDLNKLRYVNLDANLTTRTDVASGTPYEDMNNMSIDCGLVALASLGNYVWIDEDYDGKADSGETAIPGVTVTLYAYNSETNIIDTSAPVNNYYGESMTTNTDGNGFYHFGDLLPGDYVVYFENPSPTDFGFTKSIGNDELKEDGYSSVRPEGILASSTDARLQTGGYSYPVLDLTPGDHRIDLDAGFVQYLSLGDRVWIDFDYSGTQDDPTEEFGVDGVMVSLYKYLTDTPTDVEYELLSGTNMKNATVVKNGETAHKIAEWVTGDIKSTINGGAYLDGAYRFDMLYPGKYFVEFDLADVNAALKGSVDSALYPDEVQYLKMEFTTNTNVVTDASNSDVDPSEVLTSATDVISNDAGWTRDFTMNIDTVNYKDGHHPYVDAGVIILGAIGDYVWYDGNFDGMQTDTKDEPLEGVDVTLYWYDEAEISDSNPYGLNGVATNFYGQPMEAKTDTSGNYLFTGLVPGDYVVKFGSVTMTDMYGFEIESHYTTKKVTGTTDLLDSDGDEEDGITAPITIDIKSNINTLSDVEKKNAGTSVNISVKDITDIIYLRADQGMFFYSGIGDLVWYDNPYNSMQMPVYATKVGINGVTVELYQRQSGNWVLMTSTNTTDHPVVVYTGATNSAVTTSTNVNFDNKYMGQGFYLFSDLDPREEYQVRFINPNPATYGFVNRHTGANVLLDSDANVANGYSATINDLQTYEKGVYNISIDAGLRTFDEDVETSPPVTTPPVTSDPPYGNITIPNSSFLDISDVTVPYGALSRPAQEFLNIEDEEPPYSPITKTGELAIDFLVYVAAGAALAGMGLFMLRKGRKNEESGDAA